MSEDILPPNQENDESKSKDIHQEVIIPEEVEELLSELPEPQQKAVKAVLIGVYSQRIWRGPLPPPDILRDYNNAFPNGAERIFIETQKQTAHRMELEKIAIPAELSQSKRGQDYGLIIALSFLLASFVLIILGHSVAGTIIGSIDLVALVTVFVLGRYTQNSQQK